MNTELLEKLDRATDRAAGMAISCGIPIPVSNKASLINNLLVEKNKNGFYDVKTLDRKILYENISVFDVAVIVAQRYATGETSVIKHVLALENKFSKHHTDMVHYLHCMKSAKKNHDSERLAILEDRFQISEQMAKNTRDKISNFKRIK